MSPRAGLAALVAAVALVLAAAAWGATAAEEFQTPDPASAPTGITSGPDGALWFTERAVAAIGRIDTDGGLTEYPIAGVNAQPLDITTGPDGNLWATDSFAGVVHRITPDGDITDIALPTNATTDGIAAGPDGALWVTMRSADRIARVTVDGAVTELPLPVAGREPDAIVAGPDGALWFTQRTGNAIGRVTVDGAFSDVPLPTPGASPRGITVGPDGALWFAEHGIDRAGRLDPVSGTVTEVPLGAGTRPVDIAAGSDGALWLTDEGRVGLSRVTVDGHVSHTALAGAGAPVGVTDGPDGSIWFTRSPDRVGRLVQLPAPIAGRIVDVTTVSGRVLVRRPGSRRFTVLPAAGAAIPVGAEIDAARGKVRLTAAVGTATKASKTGDFSGGRFTIVQPRGTRALLTAKLSGPLAQCRARGSARAAKRRKPDERHVWGDAKGAFATSGHTAVATVRGTVWRVSDRCDGSTVVTVRSGVVSVTDTVRRKTVTVRAGRSVVIRPRR